MKSLIALLVASLFLVSVETCFAQQNPFPGPVDGVQEMPAASIAVEAAVDPGMELVAIMLWLSGKYTIPMDSAYKSEVWKHFSSYRNHAALKRMKGLTMYPDFTEMGLLLTGFPSVSATLPETNSWVKNYNRETVTGLLDDACTFARDTKFWEFHQKHRADYDRWTKTFREDLEKRGSVKALDAFFRYRAHRIHPEVTIYLEPLNAWGAHAIDFMRLRGEPNGSRFTFQLGPSEANEQFPDSPVLFQGSRNTLETIWHEESHIYLRPLLDRSGEPIGKLERLFDAPALANQNVKTWSYAFEENLVRAVVASLIRQQNGEDAYRREVKSQTQRGFVYVYELSELISSRYLADPKQYADFDAFFPEVLNTLAYKQTAADAKRLP